MSGSVLVQKLVIEDGSGEPERVFNIFDRILDTNQPALAKNIAVLLAGNLLWHLENHLDQGIDGQFRRALEKHPRLAYVEDRAFRPGAQVLDPIAQRQMES